MKGIFLIFFILCFINLNAQYFGGKGDGADKKQTIQTTLNGVIGGIRVLYQGGAGDGYNNSSISAFVNGTATSFLFSGGVGDGHSNIRMSSFLQGTSGDILYKGGNGDGFAKQNVQAFPDGTNSSLLYAGGNGDGFSKLKFSGSLNNISTAIFYSGGNGDGFSVNRYTGFMSGFNAAMLYGGGIGDGFTKNATQSFVNGLSSSIFYSGGDGDGFAKSYYTGTITVLPLKLISFNATARTDYVLLQWATENEDGTRFFTVERSQAGTIFNNILNLPATGGAARKYYDINDNNPLPGRSYYRLQWTDIDGQKGYSDIRSVVFNADAKNDFVLFPNPNEGKVLNIILDNPVANEKITVSIYDGQGKSILQINDAKLAGNKIVLNLPSFLAKGNYIVQLRRNEKTSSKILIVK